MAQICKARSKSTGERCKQPVVKGREVCRYHGGKTPRGLAAPALVHGRHSKDLPTRLLADYQAALADPEIISVREETALGRARISDLLRRLTADGDAGAPWAAVGEAVDRMAISIRGGDPAAVVGALGALQEIVARGASEAELWNELYKAIEQVRRLADTERRRLEALEQSVTRQQAVMLGLALLDAVRRHVDDRRTLAAIGAEFSAILDAPGRVGDDGRGDSSRP